MPVKWCALFYLFIFVLLCQFSNGYEFFRNWNLPETGVWKRNVELGREKVSGAYKRSVTLTGRVLVTMLGYPSQCERKGVSYSCTLAFACWLVGGISQTGCGTSPWLVSCCITRKKHNNKKQSSNNDIANGYFDVNQNNVLVETDSFNNIETREDNIPLIQIIQRRNNIGNDIEAESVCGMSSDRVFSKRIIGGQNAHFGQFPWQVYIKISSYQCGGVLVSKKFVATAAHCILLAKISNILVSLGDLDTQDTGEVKEFAPAELHRVKKKILHPKFQYRVTQPDRYDLALLELITEAGYNFHISPICLSEQNYDLTGKEAVVAGWGNVSPTSESKGSNILRSATVPILDIEECMAWHKFKQINVELHKEMMCAGHKNGKHDACLGDSGGPLIILENERWTLIGITSAGFGCGEPHQPGIYHNISVTTNWIKSIIEAFN